MPTPFGAYLHVRSLLVLPGYRLRLAFDNGNERVIDFETLLLGPLWGALRDQELFAQVRVNLDTNTIEWPNGADLNPVILHDWPEYSGRIVAKRRARYGDTSRKLLGDPGCIW
jgi:hypothetical protein